MKTCFILLLLTATISVAAQEQNFCGTQIVSETLLKNYPELRSTYEALLQNEQNSTNYAERPQIQSAPQYTIPVVFHILHLGGLENISDAQIINQVQILNRDYQKQNPDTLQVVPAFTNNIANVGIAFELAKIDPNGNCTNGIIRHYTSKTNWDANNLSDFIYTWPRNKYLNIYIVKSLNIQATAYSFLPPIQVPPNADCIVCMHNNCGSIGTSNVNFSRVLTHEVAHWLNIPHIWGSSNQPGVTCGDDGVNDTPITKGFITCNLQNNKICNPGIEENVQNYMDYSPCKLMFTNGQAGRMISCLTGTLNSRFNISSPANLIATGITSATSNCIPYVEIAAKPSPTICLGTNLAIEAYTSNASVSSYSWWSSTGCTLNAVAGESTTASFSAAGIYTVYCSASNANGSSSASVVISVNASLASVNGSYSESFETSSVPNTWKIIHQSASPISWQVINGVASHSNSSVFVDAENATGAHVEILESPSYNFADNPSASYTFKYAYARKSANHKDIFKVQASSDCGGTFKDIYTPTSQQLASGSGEIDNTLFYPAANQWKLYNLSLHPNFIPFLSKNNVIIRYYFQEDSSGAGNRLYLDEINFSSPTGIVTSAKNNQVQISPNPTSGLLNFVLEENHTQELSIELQDLSGRVLQHQLYYHMNETGISFQIDEKIAGGIYIIKLSGLDVQVYCKISYYKA